MEKLTREEERELFLRFNENYSEELFERIFNKYKYIVFKLMQKYPNCSDYEELKHCGFEGLCIAIKRFDPLKGFAFMSFAWPYVQGYLGQFFLNLKGIRIPAHLSSARSRVFSAINHLEQKNHSFQSAEDISNFLSMEESEILEVVSFLRSKNKGELFQAKIDKTLFKGLLLEINQMFPQHFRNNLEIIIRHSFNNKNLSDMVKDINVSEELVAQLTTTNQVQSLEVVSEACLHRGAYSKEKADIDFIASLKFAMKNANISERDQKLIMAYFGEFKDRTRTYESIGSMFSISKERARQIVNRVFSNNLFLLEIAKQGLIEKDYMLKLMEDSKLIKKPSNALSLSDLESLLSIQYPNQRNREIFKKRFLNKKVLRVISKEEGISIQRVRQVSLDGLSYDILDILCNNGYISSKDYSKLIKNVG
ncbi:MAG TPA: hypothetical protein GX005_00505 [Bacteroidales bacterium]|nr:hypothetical protein [Bacteroidales bacterium]